MSALIGNMENNATGAVPGGGVGTPAGIVTALSSSLAAREVPPDIIRTLPADFVKRHCLLPVAIRNGTLLIATAALAQVDEQAPLVKKWQDGAEKPDKKTKKP